MYLLSCCLRRSISMDWTQSHAKDVVSLGNSLWDPSPKLNGALKRITKYSEDCFQTKNMINIYLTNEPNEIAIYSIGKYFWDYSMFSSIPIHVNGWFVIGGSSILQSQKYWWNYLITTCIISFLHVSIISKVANAPLWFCGLSKDTVWSRFSSSKSRWASTINCGV